jgi:hypothetical protein
MRRKIEDTPGEGLLYCYPCRKNKHVGPNGYNVRYKNGMCLHCNYNMPPGEFTLTFENMPDKKPQLKRYATKEEAYAAHVERQKIWNKEHPETFYKAQMKYRKKPERKKIASDKNKEWWANLPKEKKQERYKNKIKRLQKETPEQAEVRRQKQREWYAKNRDKILEYRREHKKPKEPK